MAETVLGGAIELLQDFGFFDIILPFLLVFTVVFGILEKTKIFGTEQNGATKKNLDSMVAFTIAFFVVTAKEIVSAINESLPMVALVLIAILCFLMLVGAFFTGENEFNFSENYKGATGVFAGVLGVALILIFFQSFGWLTPVWDYINGIGNDVFIIIVFVAFTLGIMFFVFNAAEVNNGNRS